MNAKSKTKSTVIPKGKIDVTYAVCEVGIVAVFAFAAVVGVISLLSLGVGITVALF